jgi:CheY-like chemotaxis protein
MPAPAVILLAEDREDDITLILKAFAKAQVCNPLQIVRDGEEAIAYLRGEGKYANRDEFPLPALVLLDLKMPKVDGFEVLKWLRQQPGLSALRVVVLTSSDAIRDVNTAYHLGANSFMVKPMDFNDVVQMSRFLTDYWLQTSMAPETFRPPRESKNGISEQRRSDEPSRPDSDLRAG